MNGSPSTSIPPNPYQAPQEFGNEPPVMAAPPMAASEIRGRPFESGNTRALVTVVLLVIGILAAVAGMVSTWMEIGLLESVAAGARISEAQVLANDSRQAAIGFIQIAISLVTAIAYLMWVHRAHRNLPSLGGQNLKYSPGWAVGSFFVPILNLFWPYQITQEIFVNSDPKNLADTNGLPPNAGMPLVGRSSVTIMWWWGLWVVSNIAGQIAFRVNFAAEELPELINGDWILMVCDILSIMVAALAISFIREIDENQEERHRLITSRLATR